MINVRNRFDEQLHTLNHELLEMGALIERAIRSATDALVKQDVEAALQAIAADKEVDQAERDIESLCLKLLLQQQPVARDLRLISSALKMITDMERIGDQASIQRMKWFQEFTLQSVNNKMGSVYICRSWMD